MATHVHHVRVHQVSLPMRMAFAHAAAERRTTETLIVELELGNGTTGFGEAAPRPYVSGETLASSAQAVRAVFVDRLMRVRPQRFSDLLNLAAELPFADAAGRPITSARAAVELALLDAYSRSFGRSLDEIAGWLGASLFAAPGSCGTVRYGGVISAGDARQTLRRLRLPRLGGLRDFKLKVGREDDRQVIEAVFKRLARPVRRGRATVRADANGAFSPEQAADWIERMADLPIAALEQPLARGRDEDLPALRAKSLIPIMADESLVTPADADRLIETEAVDLFNIRISKNGGLIAALRLAERARSADLGYQLGCMVGETGLLSMAGRWFLALCRGVRWAEGSFGRLLLADDVTRPSPRFRWGGRFRPPTGLGLGVEVDREKLARHAVAPPIDVQL